MFTLVVGMTVLVLSQIELSPCGPLQKGETGRLAFLNDQYVIIQFHTTHWDWPSQWHNELMVYLDNAEVLTQLKFISMAGLLAVVAGPIDALSQLMMN